MKGNHLRFEDTNSSVVSDKGMGCASATHDTRTYHVYFVCNLYLSIYLICEITIFIKNNLCKQQPCLILFKNCSTT